MAGTNGASIVARTANPMPLIQGGGGPGTLALGPDVPTILYSDPKRGGDGGYCINEDKGLVKWRWSPLTLNGQNQFAVPLAANQITDFDLQVGGAAGIRGDTEYATLLASSTGRFAVQPYVSSPVDKQLSNIPIPSNLMFGTSLLPGFLPSSLYCMAGSTWRVKVQELSGLSNTISMASWGRKFMDNGREGFADQRRRAALHSVVWPYWIGPQNTLSAAQTGPEVTLAANASVTLRFPIPSNADFLCKWILDDSSSTTGVEPLLAAQIQEDDTTRNLVDHLPSGTLGISWRDFIACPTVTITNMPTGGIVRAMSLGSPRGGWTHLFKRTSQVNITFISTDSGTITLRPALVGWCLRAEEPDDRQYSNDAASRADRVAQAAARGASPVRLYEGR